MNYEPDETAYETSSENDYSFGNLCSEIARFQFKTPLYVSDLEDLEIKWRALRCSISEDAQNVTDNVLTSLKNRALETDE